MRCSVKLSQSPLLRIAAVAVIVVLGALGGSAVTRAATTRASVVNLVFGTQGLGAEGQASKVQIQKFMKKYPNIHVTIDTHSASANDAYQSYITTLASGSGTPDVINSDVIWPAGFAAAGFITPLGKFHYNRKAFFPGMAASGIYKGKAYAVPWFINAEGLYYRKDLVGSPPRTPAQLIAKARAAMKKGAKYGIVFEANKYEGLVTDFVNWLGAFGGTILNKKGQPVVNSGKAVKALTFMVNMVKTYKVAPPAVTGWEEGNVESAFDSGAAAMAVNWPYVFSIAEAKGSKVKGKVGWTTVPTSGGHPTACLGGSDLIINAKSKNQAAAWKLVQFLSSKPQQIYRGKVAGDPPALKAAYGPALYKAASFYRQEKAVFTHATPRPVNPKYTQISDALQIQLSNAFAGSSSPKAALDAAESAIKSIVK